MATKIIEDHPDWKALQKEKEQLLAGEKVYQERRRKQEQEYADTLADWNKKVEAAMLQGREPPKRPERPELVGDPRFFIDRKMNLQAREREFLATTAVELQAQLAAQLEKIEDEARPLVKQIEKLAARAEATFADLRTIESATKKPGAPSKLPRRPIGAADLVDHIARGESLLRPRREDSEENDFAARVVAQDNRS